MERWRTHTRLPVLLDALGRPEHDPSVRQLAEQIGGEPVAVRERRFGEPAIHCRRSSFAAGVEIILHDGLVAAILLHLEPTPSAPGGLDLSEWMPGAGNDATLDDLREAVGGRLQFAGSDPYFALGEAYLRPVFRAKRGWKVPGNLLGVSITGTHPGLARRPEDDDCPTCGDLLVRPSDADDGIDVGATIGALTAALSAGLLTEDAHRVRLADLQPLRDSGLMERMESQLTCVTCRRIICITLFRDSSPTFGFHVLNDALRRPFDVVPPVDQWGDAARIAADRDAMHYVDHEPGMWFLVEKQDELHLHARYSSGAAIDDSALIRLDDAELEAYRLGGHDSLTELATAIHDSAPYRDDSPYFTRDLNRGPDGRTYRSDVGQAIAAHTWIAQQGRGNAAHDRGSASDT